MSVNLGTEDVIRLRYVEREMTVVHAERGAQGPHTQRECWG